MDLRRHHYFYSYHHPYRLAGARYGAVSPYQLLTIPRCTCECYCERNGPQLSENDAGRESSEREGQSREFVELKNGTALFLSQVTFSPHVPHRFGHFQLNFSSCASF